ncbi:hypothetical protein N7D90_10545 [Pseudomonas fragi]|uniref:hypothetical protein n=1 Tax=Pseudomonas fragi TaxID=296 RepID=UPI0021BECBB6|nr:hypothetical protein [Pseudomonas fragi]UXL40552.1 hypothetical protein N7D90_10545 [Pseudomonas fragi]
MQGIIATIARSLAVNIRQRWLQRKGGQRRIFQETKRKQGPKPLFYLTIILEKKLIQADQPVGYLQEPNQLFRQETGNVIPHWFLLQSLEKAAH